MSALFFISVLAAATCCALGAAPACGAGLWADGATCKPCSVCGAKEVLLFPCSETRDVFCADAGFLRSIKPLQDGGAPVGGAEQRHPRWHETEGGGAEVIATKRPRAEKSFWTAVLESHWNVVLAVALVAALAFVALALGITVFRKCGPRKSSGGSPLSRFFASSSTDYMHHLAMDELLDRKQRGGARYEPQRLHDNVYVDCAAIPRFEERPDYSRSLLRLRDEQQ